MLFVLEINIIIINYGIAVRDALIGNENYGKGQTSSQAPFILHKIQFSFRLMSKFRSKKTSLLITSLNLILLFH